MLAAVSISNTPNVVQETAKCEIKRATGILLGDSTKSLTESVESPLPDLAVAERTKDKAYCNYQLVPLENAITVDTPNDSVVGRLLPFEDSSFHCAAFISINREFVSNHQLVSDLPLWIAYWTAQKLMTAQKSLQCPGTMEELYDAKMPSVTPNI